MNNNSVLGHERLVGPETLRAEQQSIVDRNIAVLQSAGGQSQGVLVGVMRGNEAWDLRPVFLSHIPQKGTLHVVRFAHASLALDKKRFQMLSELSQKVGVGTEKSSVLALGQAEGQFWTKRRFFPQTLKDAAAQKSIQSSGSALRIIREIIESLKSLHEKELFHGHVCLENIGFENDKPVFLDYGLQTLAGSKPLELSLETLRKKDIFDLGTVLEELGGQGLGATQRDIINRMKNSNEAARPSLSEVAQEFRPSYVRETGKIVGGSDSARVKTGKVLGQGLSSSNVEAEVALPEVQQFPREVTPSLLVKRESQEAKAEQIPEASAAATGKFPTSFLVLLAIGAILIGYTFHARFLRSADREDQYRNEWSSGKQNEVQHVVEAAVIEQDESAQSVILADAEADKPVVQFRSDMLRAAFNPHWADDLKASDRQIVFTLALSKLLPEGAPKLPALAEAHPGIILAVIGDLSLKGSEGQFQDIPLEPLTELPPPYGMAFSELRKLKIEKMGDLSARALSRILIGNFGQESLEGFLASDPNARQSKLLLLLSFTELFPGLVDQLLAYLPTFGDPFTERFEWFDAESIADWSSLGKRERLYILLGLVPDTPLTLEQYVDLLNYPMLTAREEAKRMLLKGLLDASEEGVLRFLASDANNLTRFQSVSLCVALHSKGELSFPLISRWFETNPDTKSLVQILLVRRGSGKIDAWNVEAARYLSAHDWEASVDELKTLSQHSEPLARALAYSRLDPSDAEQARILRDGMKRENNPKIRAEIERKLNSAK